MTIAPSATTAWNATAHAGLFGPSRPTASPGPIPSAARPDAARATWSANSAYVVTAPVGAVDQRRLVAARGRPAEHVLGQGDGRDLDVGVRAAQDHPRSLALLAAGGGGVETTKSGSDGGSPASSNVPSDSSSTPSTMWRTETARYSWRSAAAVLAARGQLARR